MVIASLLNFWRYAPGSADAAGWRRLHLIAKGGQGLLKRRQVVEVPIFQVGHLLLSHAELLRQRGLGKAAPNPFANDHLGDFQLLLVQFLEVAKSRIPALFSEMIVHSFEH